jgi:hypothetical protein
MQAESMGVHRDVSMCACPLCRHLDRHLDADEAVVLGAGLFAANLSSSFRLRVSGDVPVPWGQFAEWLQFVAAGFSLCCPTASDQG